MGKRAQHSRDRGHDGVASPEHHGRADECHGWKGLANNYFSFAAAANVWRGGSGIRANAGNVDQLPDMRFSGEPRDSCCSCYMDGMEGLLAALHIETHGVHDALNSRHGSGNGAIIIDVGMDRTRCRAQRRGKGLRCVPDAATRTRIENSHSSKCWTTWRPRKPVPPNTVTFPRAIVPFPGRCRRAVAPRHSSGIA